MAPLAVVALAVPATTPSMWAVAAVDQQTTAPPRAVSLDRVSKSARTTVAIIDTGVAPIPGVGSAVWWRASRSLVPGENLKDTDGHGTAMASIIHAGAPEARILAIKALDNSGDGSDKVIAKAIEYATSAGARVINLSISGAEPLPRVRRALRAAARKGVLAVVAAGNDGLDIGKYASYPASYRLPNLVAVGAADENGNLLPDSNFGASVAVTAQGQAVPACSADGSPVFEGGSSAAAALIAAQAARLAAAWPKRSPARIRASLSFESAHPLPFSCDAARRLASPNMTIRESAAIRPGALGPQPNTTLTSFAHRSAA